MQLSISQKQNFFYFGLIILVILLSLFIYHLTQTKWLFFREAENKFQEKSFQEAVNLYLKSLDIGPTTPTVLVHLADSYVVLGNFNEAVKYYHLYLKVRPSDSAVRILLARALSWNGNIEEAEKEYQKVMEESHEEESNS